MAKPWSIIKRETPVLPWDNDETAVIWPRLAQAHGNPFALRMWGHFESYVTILRDVEDDALCRVKAWEFMDGLVKTDPEDAADFAEVLRLCRIVGGGLERQRARREAAHG